MLIKINRKPILFVFTVMVLMAMACNLPSRRSAATPTVAPLTPQDAQQFEDNLQSTLSSAEAGSETTITLSESQLSAYLAAQLSSQSDQVITNPRVRLTDGRMEISAQVDQGIKFEANSVVVPSINSSGEPRLLVQSVSLGSIPVPESIIEQMQKLVDTLLDSYLTSQDSQFKITNIQINEGELVVSGIPE